jgi:predicted ATPase/class 3 adenylate cyclase
MRLPTGTVTFLFTDIEGSTSLWERDEAAARQMLERHDQIIEQLVQRNGGALVRPRGEGDSRFAVFEMAPNAVAAAVEIQRAFAEEPWPAGEPLRIRVGLHTGNADLRQGDYYGSAVNRCARVRALGHGGQVLLSLATQQLTADDLPEGVSLLDLGTHPLKGLKRPDQIFQLIIPGIPSEFPALKSKAGPRINLPDHVTPFIGRETELAEVGRLLSDDGARLLTLKGPGGIGKTRLAIEVAGRAAPAYRDGATFVALAPLDSADQIVQAFLEALDLRPATQEDPKDFLLQYLRRAELLLVVDNFEHVLDAAPFMADILERSPNVRILATSRERLGLRAETVYDVAGLEFADWRNVEEATRASCAQLFLQGARQIEPHFELTLADVSHLARICRLVGGIPLALLLSAGWMDVLALEEIADEIAANLDFLETELRDAPTRQRSVRAVFETSWERLDEPERKLFKKLSVFRGGFAREAANQVAVANLRSLARLTDKSFLRRNPETGRYEIHELLRQFGEQRLLENDQSYQRARRAHARYFTERLAALETRFKAGIEAEGLDEIETDIENIRSAWGFSAESGDTEALQRSLFAVWFFHEVRCWLHAGRELFISTARRLRESAQEIAVELTAHQLLSAASFFDLMLGFPAKGTGAARESLDWLTEHGYQDKSTYSLLTLGVAGNFLRNPDQAIRIGDQLSALAEETGQKWWELRGKTMANGGRLLSGELDEAERYLMEYDRLIVGIGGPWTSFWGKQGYAMLALARGDYARAKELFQSIIDSLQSVSFLRGMQYAHSNLAHTHLILAEFEEAEQHFTQSLRISLETGQIRETLGNLIGLAKVWHGQERDVEAVEAVASVLHHAQADQSNLFTQWSIREEAEALRDALEGKLDPDAFREAWDAGSGEEAEELAARINSKARAAG